ncbi:MAG: hypothetical protein HY548_06430 [Elusimicrobia bacterium]|nr:hypothetical protein [Elusimicrobiota bacterium]
MPFAAYQKKFGFKKEVTRGVSEAAPAKFLAVGPESEMAYKAATIPDDKIRGVKGRFAASPGVLDGSGNLNPVDLEASTIGDLLLGCLGSVATSQPDATNSPTVFRHIFSALNQTKLPSFTFFEDRGISVKRYPLTTLKKLAFTGAVNGKAQLSAEVVFKTEEPASAFTAVYGSPKPFMFFQTDIKVDGVSDANIKSWNLSIDNGAQAQRTLNLSRDAKDILAVKPLTIEGGFEIYFETEAQRQKFLDVGVAALDLILTGGIIEDTFKNELKLSLPEINYTEYPYGLIEDLLGAAVKFQANISPSTGYNIQATLTNAVAVY